MSDMWFQWEYEKQWSDRGMKTENQVLSNNRFMAHQKWLGSLFDLSKKHNYTDMKSPIILIESNEIYDQNLIYIDMNIPHGTQFLFANIL